MAQPTAYTREQDFTVYQDFDAEGSELNREFDNITTTTNEVRVNLDIIQKDDGQLSNDSVGNDQLKSEVLTTLAATTATSAANAQASETAASDSADDASESADEAAAHMVAGIGAMQKFRFTATTGQTDITGVDDDGVDALELHTGKEIVTLNGIFMESGTDYTATSDTIVMDEALAAGDEVNIYAFGSFDLSTHYTKTQSEARYALDSDVTTLTSTVSGNSTDIGNLQNDKAAKNGAATEVFNTSTASSSSDTTVAASTEYVTSAVSVASSTLNSTITTAVSGHDTKQNIIDAIYPTGSIYTSTASANPSTFLGGSWDAFGEGRVLIGKADSGTFSSAGATGGSETHQLTEAQMPAHTHGVTHTTVTEKVTGSYDGNRTHSNLNANASTETTTTTGSGNEHNNLQPYVVVYMWKRTG